MSIERVETSRLRLRVFFVFFGLTMVVLALLAGSLWLAATHLDVNAGNVLLRYGIATGFVLLGAITWVWFHFDTQIARPIQALVRDMETVTHANLDHQINEAATPYIKQISSSAQAMAGSLSLARKEVQREIERATQAIDAQKQKLEVILQDLHEGVLICNLNHQVLLYNQRALKILHVAGELGLGRSLFGIVNRQPFFHAIERLSNRLKDKRHEAHPDGLTAPIICSTADGRHILEGRVSLIVDTEEQATGYTVTLENITEELAALGARDRLLREAIEGIRRPVTNLRAAVEMLTNHPSLAAEDRRKFEAVIANECDTLSTKVEKLGLRYHDQITGNWPMSDVYSANLLNCLVRRLREEKGVDGVMVGFPTWLHGDSHSIVELLDHIIHRIHHRDGISHFDLEAQPNDRRVYLDVVWEGEVIHSQDIEAWLAEPLEGGLGGMSARDVLDHHKAILWCEMKKDGRARIRLPLPSPLETHLDSKDTETKALPARPEFYDFDLLSQSLSDPQDDRPLHDLTYVVFDTETTGLEPSEGDEIISIAGVRIVNGRILTGESFSEFVHPGKSIPKRSIQFHGITDEMVKGKPPVTAILSKFHDFVGDAVLVAHNAAFDLKFLELKKDTSGVSFDQPVLDTVLLSAFLHDHTHKHTLDDVAERFGIEIQGRHTALGDALVTAGVFLKMLELLKSQGVTTLGQAIKASNRIMNIRRQQTHY